MELIELKCKSCGATLNPENIVPRLAMARCDHCGAVFALSGVPWSGAREKAESIERPQVPMPKGIRVQAFGDSLEITRRWYNHGFLFLAFFCLMWNGFMIVWHVIALSMGAWFMSLFGLLHTAVGIGLAYFTGAGFLNRTVIRARRGLIEVTSGPVPWPGNLTLSTDDLEQLYCTEKVRQGKNGTSCSYEIHAITSGPPDSFTWGSRSAPSPGKVRKTLLKGLTDAEQALFIEQQLERFLGIEDKPVRGEIPR
jgi:hypothetical protein